jgi:hypothetical protein
MKWRLKKEYEESMKWRVFEKVSKINIALTNVTKRKREKTQI